ncbi:peptidoglycan -binding protein [Defluviimonas sp. SAOS-178_SWC]|uniref:peptidoglycan -binding protein n=1 Tax=Defluviimonas sp. SAOS-178_SWC TaxID=3121287 RepID=UPI0032215B7F
MALSQGRGGQRFSANIWPGFVDAMTALLMVLMFVLTIFMIVQFTLRETINTQDDELAALADQVAGLADALGLERGRTADLNAEVAGLSANLTDAKAAADRQSALIATLTSQIEGQTAKLSEAEAKITSFEAQVASLLSERDAARGEADALGAERDQLLTAQEALNLAVAKAREEIDAQAEAARLAAARRAALEALTADLRARAEKDAAALAETQGTLDDKAKALSDAEAARLAEAAAAEALRTRLKGAEDELTAMTLALEDERKKAEDTLTLLAAAEAARKDLDGKLAAALLAQNASAEELAAARAAAEATRTASASDRQAIETELAAALAAKLSAEQTAETTLSEAERQKALLAAANARLAEERAASAEAARKVALLNQQITALRSQLGSLQNLLDASAAKDADSRVQIEALGSQLNSALARVAAEEKRRAALEEAERIRLEEEAKALKAETRELSRYRSEFFGKLSEVLAGREGVRVVGDRFVFSSEVLFEPGAADLAPEGRSQIAGVVATLQEVAAAIPPEIDWIIRVDGHTDNVPLSGFGQFHDNWELSQARALSVVRYMQNSLGFPPERLAAAGFGEYRPVAEGDTPEARAQNRRIELKLTER